MTKSQTKTQRKKKTVSRRKTFRKNKSIKKRSVLRIHGGDDRLANLRVELKRLTNAYDQIDNQAAKDALWQQIQRKQNEIREAEEAARLYPNVQQEQWSRRQQLTSPGYQNDDQGQLPRRQQEHYTEVQEPEMPDGWDPDYWNKKSLNEKIELAQQEKRTTERIAGILAQKTPDQFRQIRRDIKRQESDGPKAKPPGRVSGAIMDFFSDWSA